MLLLTTLPSSYSFIFLRSKHAQSATLLQELRPGMRLHGGVVGVTDFAAFLDVKVVRKGPGGKVSERREEGREGRKEEGD
jgi:hypothetical protein